MRKIFNLKDVIQKEVNLEAEIEHLNDPKPIIPKVSLPVVKKDAVWWKNFFISNVAMFRP